MKMIKIWKKGLGDRSITVTGQTDEKIQSQMTAGTTAFEYDKEGIPIKRMMFGEPWKDYSIPWPIERIK